MTYCNAVRDLYPGLPPQVDFTITFEYQDRDDVKVSLWDANQTTPPTREYVILTEYDGSNTQPAGHYYQWQNATTIRFVTELGANDPPPVPTADPVTGDVVDNVLIFRLTDVDPARAIFAPGSSIRAQDLNDNFEQLAFGIEESRCLIERLGDEADLNYWNKFDDTDYSTETYQGDDLHIASNAMNEEQFATFVQTSIPDAQGVVGKTWYVDDDTQLLYIWNGTTWKGVKASTQGDTIYDNVWFVSPGGDDVNSGHSVTRAKRTIGNAVTAAQTEGVDNGLVFVFPGVYDEDPMSIQASNLSIVGQAIRSCFIHPRLTQAQIDAYDIDTPVGNELATMFLCDNGTYISGFTIAGIKAAGIRGAAGSIDEDSTYGLPPQQGWVAAFRPGCNLRKSPYIQNCTVFSDSQIDNRPYNAAGYPDGRFGFDPNQLAGEGVAGDLDSAPTGGGILCDGNTPVANSPLKSFVVDSFTQINLNGPGILCTNNGYAQLVSFFGTFCFYHAKALNGGQLNLSNCTTDFGEYSLVASGMSPLPLIEGNITSPALTGYTFDGTNYTAGSIQIPVENLTAVNNWTTNIPGETYVMEVVTGGTNNDFYLIGGLDAYDSTAGTATVNILSPQPSQASENLGLYRDKADSATPTVRFYRQSYISTGGHTFEFVGSGMNYNAVPERGGQPDEQKQIIELGGVEPDVGGGVVAADQAHWALKNGGRVWASSTDEAGRFKVGGSGNTLTGNVVLIADQKTGALTINPDSVDVDSSLVSDTNPRLGGNLQLNGWGMGTGITATNPARINTAGDPGPNTVRIYSDANHDVRILEQDGSPLPSALRIPVGTEDERPDSPSHPTTVTVDAQPGHIRYNTTEETFEGFTGADNATGEWGPLGGLKPEDVGTNPNQIPTNQMLGQMAFVDNVATLRPFTVNIAAPTAANNPQPVFVGEGVLVYNTNTTAGIAGLYFNYRQDATTVVLTKLSN